MRDIEDLAREGKESLMCPYFQQISKLPEADLILVPYNYILDRNIMQQFDIKVEKTILIFDEGHNL